MPETTWLRRPDPLPVLPVEDYSRSSEIEYIHTALGVAWPDMDWVFTDPAGHVHRFVQQGDAAADVTPEWLPTLVKEMRHIECDGTCYAITHGDCDGVNVVVWFCRECRAEIEPGFVLNFAPIPLHETITHTVVIRSSEEPPDKIEAAEIVVIGASTWPLSNDPREDAVTIPVLLRADAEMQFGAGPAEFTATYRAEETRNIERGRRMRL